MRANVANAGARVSRHRELALAKRPKLSAAGYGTLFQGCEKKAFTEEHTYYLGT